MRHVSWGLSGFDVAFARQPPPFVDFTIRLCSIEQTWTRGSKNERMEDFISYDVSSRSENPTPGPIASTGRKVQETDLCCSCHIPQTDSSFPRSVGTHWQWHKCTARTHISRPSVAQVSMLIPRKSIPTKHPPSCEQCQPQYDSLPYKPDPVIRTKKETPRRMIDTWTAMILFLQPENTNRPYIFFCVCKAT